MILYIFFEVYSLTSPYSSFHTLDDAGKAKTMQVGEWTPPVLLITMNGNRLFCTNHNNVECDLEDCFRIRPTKRPMLFTYKTFDVKAISMHLVNPEVYFQVVDEIIAFNAMKRKASNFLRRKMTQGYR